MQAADDVEFGGSFADTLFGALVNLFQRKIVSAGGIGIAAEGTEFAVRNANVGGIDVAVDVVISDVAVFFLANVIGEPAYGEQVRRTVELDAIVEAETLAGENFVGYGPQTLVGEDKVAQVDNSSESRANYVR